jgi:protein-S-isoprenylcysteine O-methyltransferase Ste14
VSTDVSTDLSTDLSIGEVAPPRWRSGRWLLRAVPVVVFGVLTAVAAAHLDSGRPSDAAVVGRSAYVVLLTLQVVAFATQPPPRARDGRAWVWVVTVVATFGMVVAPSLPSVRPLWAAGERAAEVQAVLGLVGMAIALPAMAHLRRAFSLTPQVRGLITTGPYRVVRHPLYLGEALNVIGIMVAVGSLTVLLVAAIVVAGEVARATLEERLLRRSFPQYDRTFAGVAHLIPGVW